jgi:hypothetical protein
LEKRERERERGKNPFASSEESFGITRDTVFSTLFVERDSLLLNL